MIEETLQKIARQIMALNEETLVALLPRYKERMLNFVPTRQWEESVVIYFLINGLKTKNSRFNDKIKEYMASGENSEKGRILVRPRLRLVKTEEVRVEIENHLKKDENQENQKIFAKGRFTGRGEFSGRQLDPSRSDSPETEVGGMASGHGQDSGGGENEDDENS